MMNKLLTICVSWQRPELLRKMMNSFFNTRKIADLFIYICDDDPKLEEYKQVLHQLTIENKKFFCEIGPHLYIGEVSNYVPTIKNYEYYQMINDDHEFIGEGWDTDMVEALDKEGGWRLAASYMPEELMIDNHPDALKNPINAPTAEIFSRKIIDALGFYNFPGFKQYGCDGYIMELGEDLGGIIPFCGKILHNCAQLHRMERDNVWDYIYSEENKHQGDEIIRDWMLSRPLIRERIKKAKEKEYV